MGSAAFLVAAARYLAGYLIDAWLREGDPRVAAYQSTTDEHRTSEDEDPVVIEARRQIIEHCLYGVDINPMAVEMAKLSLWLVSMDPRSPLHVLGRQPGMWRLAARHHVARPAGVHAPGPKRGREIHERSPVPFTAGVRSLVGEVATIRRRINEVALGTDPLAGLAEKRRLLGEAEKATEQARLFADLVVGATLANVKRGDRGLTDASMLSADYARRILSGSAEAEREAEDKRRAWLATDYVPGSFVRQPLHWPLVFPEVIEGDGFDAIVGNPPFLGGQKLTGTLGVAYREYLVAAIGRGARGSADLVAYFALRANDLLNKRGQTGLIATNTLAQGDTREVGLDQVVATGATIRRAVKSKPWPSKSAALEYCAVWTSRALLSETAHRLADETVVRGITLAEPRSGVACKRQRSPARSQRWPVLSRLEHPLALVS